MSAAFFKSPEEIAFKQAMQGLNEAVESRNYGAFQKAVNSLANISGDPKHSKAGGADRLLRNLLKNMGLDGFLGNQPDESVKKLAENIPERQFENYANGSQPGSAPSFTK